MIENLALVEWSRAQFALTAMYHWLFVPLTLGLSVILAVMESIYLKTGKDEWKQMTKFWMRIFAVNFAIGVATGLILEFQFGTNWSNYSWMVGDIFGAPLAIEGIMAFFIEATFFAVMFFGWERVSKRFHLFSTWMVAVGSSLSALWILVANAWMNLPVGMKFNPDSARSEMVDFWAVIFSPMAMAKYTHTVSSGFVYAAVVVVGISSWFLLKKRHKAFAMNSILVASVFGLFSSLYLAYTGDVSAQQVAKYQPMKLAAMEGLYNGKNGADLTLVGILNSKKTIDNNEPEMSFSIKAPKMLSYLSFRSFDAFVPGINDLVRGNAANGIVSVQQRMDRGKLAIDALDIYKEAKLNKNDSLAAKALVEFNANFNDFGYGQLKTPEQIVPSVPLVFYSFRIMVILGSMFIGLFAIALYLAIKKKTNKWFSMFAVINIPLGIIAGMAGWIVAEVGRQPWAIQDLLAVSKATSNIEASNVKITFFIFAVLFTVLLIAEIKILFNVIKKGPEGE